MGERRKKGPQSVLLGRLPAHKIMLGLGNRYRMGLERAGEIQEIQPYGRVLGSVRLRYQTNPLKNQTR
jgi:hypothetical protein